MDREALVLRNRAMAEAFHQVPLKHLVRRGLLRAVSHLPFAPIPKPAVERILLIRPDHLGDMLLTMPAVHALRLARPHAEIHVLAGPWAAEVLANTDDVDSVLTLRFPGFSRRTPGGWRSPYEQAVTVSRLLRRVGYTDAVIMRPDHWWGAMLAHMAGIPRIVGYDLPDVACFLTEALPFRKQHAVLLNLRLVERWAGMVTHPRLHFPVSEVDTRYIDAYLDAWGIAPRTPLVCIHPGAGTWAKQWEEAKWAAVADTLADQLTATIVFTGTGHEIPVVRRIAEQMQHRPCLIAGDTQIGQLAALFARSSVVLGPDSGPLHLAVAVGAPTVALFGPADPTEFGPWGTPEKNVILFSEIGCRPCGVLDWGTDDPENHPCVREITVGRVLEAARRASSFALSPG